MSRIANDEQKIYVLMSGGLNSFIGWHWMKKTNVEETENAVLVPVIFNYGQRAFKHQLSALKAFTPGATIEVVDIGTNFDYGVTKPNYHLIRQGIMKEEVPFIHYIMFYTLRAIHKDSRIYAFWSAENSIESHRMLFDFRGILEVPFAGLFKPQILANYEVEMTEYSWSCIDGGKKIHCGTCTGCLRRKHTFSGAKVEDKTRYAS